MEFLSKKVFCLYIISGILFFAFLGCAHRSDNTAVFSKPAWNPSKKICILPFENLTKEADAGQKVMETFITELFAAEIFHDIVEQAHANQALRKFGISKLYFDKETSKMLGERLEAQYLVLGTVTDFTYGNGKGSASEVGLSVRMIDVDTGNILWTGNSHKDGNASLGRIFGITDGPNPAALTTEICRDIIYSLKNQIAKKETGKKNLFFWKARKSDKNSKGNDKIVNNVEESVEKRR